MTKQIAEYLDLLNFSYKWNEAEGTFHLVFAEKIDGKDPDSGRKDEKGKVEYTIRISVSSNWVQVHTDIYEIDKIPDEKKSEVMLDLLAANRKYAEVCFDFNETSRCIGTSQEQSKRALSFDTFKAEFLAVPWAVRKFWSDIAKKHNLE
ncbi:MAG: hypothetical protein ACW99U_07470 [Candidatus Thorarchaeota archaeon]|jgi:hypothetical protein